MPPDAKTTKFKNKNTNSWNFTAEGYIETILKDSVSILWDEKEKQQPERKSVKFSFQLNFRYLGRKQIN